MELPTRGGRRSPKPRSRLVLDEHLGKPGALSTLARVSVATRDKRECFSEIAKAAATLLRARAISVWVDGGTVLRGEGTFTTDPRRRRRPIILHDARHGDGLVGRVFWTRGPEYVLDVQSDRRWPDPDVVRTQGLHGLAALPLITDRVVGVLAIFFPDRRHFTADEKDVMTFLADQAAVAIDHARRVSALERRCRITDGVVDLLCAGRDADGRDQDLVQLARRDARAVSIKDTAPGAGTEASAGVAAFAVPLKSGTAVVGALGFVAAPERRFAPDIIELAERFAMGAVALLTPSVAGEARRLSGRAADDLGERAGGIVWEADAYSGRFTFVSRRAEPLTGYGIGEWRGDAEFWGRLVHPEDRAEAARRRAEAMREGTDFDLEYRILTKSGRAVRVRDSARAVRDATGTLRQWRGVMVELAVSVRMREAGEHLEQLPLL